jgi:hypothetical protein
VADLNLPFAHYAVLRELPLSVSDHEQGCSIAEATDNRPSPRRWALDYSGMPDTVVELLEAAFGNVDHRHGGGELNFYAPDGTVVGARTTSSLRCTRRGHANNDASVELIELLSRD